MNNYNENIEINNKEASYIMIKIIGLLVGLQVTRRILKEIIFLFFDYSKFTDVLISMVIIIFLTFFIIHKSKKENIELNVFSYMKNKESQNYYILITICMLLLILMSVRFVSNPSFETLITLLYPGVIIPIYEEIIFRSYIWNVLKKDNKDELKIYLITTVLFSIFQIGYVDTVIMDGGFTNISWIIFLKGFLTLIYGFFIGFFRYEIKNSYSCILIHSFINIIIR